MLQNFSKAPQHIAKKYATFKQINNYFKTSQLV